MAPRWTKGEIALRAKTDEWYVAHGLSHGDWTIHKDDHGYYNLSYKGKLIGITGKQSTCKGLHGLLAVYDLDNINGPIRPTLMQALATLVRAYVANTEIADSYDVESQIALVGKLFKQCRKFNGQL